MDEICRWMNEVNQYNKIRCVNEWMDEWGEAGLIQSSRVPGLCVVAA